MKRHSPFPNLPNLPDLPVLQCVEPLRAALRRHTGAVLSAPPGSGKTTLVPLALLNETWLENRRIIMLEPRRVAARFAAQRMAALLEEKVGQHVGYRVRFDTKVSRQTRIEVVTQGILMRRLQADPELENVGLVIFDEVHERSLDNDLSLALTLDVRAGLRPDLRVLAMSATLDAGPLQALLGTKAQPAPLLQASGREYPVELRYEASGAGARGLDPDAVAEAVRRALVEHADDILVFLPGAREIHYVAGRLEDMVESAGVEVLPFYGELSREGQERALRRGEYRRVLLATNIAETSLTIEGVGVVVDGGFARVPRFDPNSGLTRLVTTRISQASADQRAGRAGRLGPGVAYRLWSEHDHASLPKARRAEIHDADLAALTLELANWGARADALAWLDSPPTGALSQARELLVELGAFTEAGRITTVGQRMTVLPSHPRLARMLVGSADSGDAGTMGLACDLAAIVEGRNPFRPRGGERTDLEARLLALETFRNQGRVDGGIDRGACAQLNRTAKQLLKRLDEGPGDLGSGSVRGAPGSAPAAAPLGAGALLSLAYPDRIAHRRGAGAGRYHLTNGRGVRLSEDDPLGLSQWLVVAQANVSGADGRIVLAATIDPAAVRSLHGHRIALTVRVAWHAGEEAVQSVVEERLGGLVLSAKPAENATQAAIAAAMTQGIRLMGLRSLPWSDEALGLQARVNALHAWCKDEDWPDFGDAGLLERLEEWLTPALVGLRRRQHLRRLQLEPLLGSYLGWPLRGRLDEGAPTHVSIPSGRRAALDYVAGNRHDSTEAGAPPVLAVRLQELFGMLDTPRVAWGRMPVTVHLLSPAGRPVQVTQDLAGFWRNTYEDVRKELKGRYPKHYWPADPHTAVATRYVRQRRRAH